MKNKVLVIFLGISTVLVGIVISADDNRKNHQLSRAYDVATLVRGYGYSFEKYTVTTDDGYILGIHRVPASPNNVKTDKPPVLIMHGLLGSSADFFHIGPGKSLPLRLADEGYDVWLGNNRGNSYSRSHTTLNPDNDTFWDFSLHDIGTHDTPAIIDFILNTTKTNNISCVGHSTGSTQFFIMSSVKPEYNSKVNVLAALAPIVYMQHTNSLLLKLVNRDDYPYILAAEQYFNMTEFLPSNTVLDTALGFLCKVGIKTSELCADLIFLITGFDTDELNRENIPKFFHSFPAGISTKEMNHVLQLVISGQFRQYDYGKIKNLALYKSITPPNYLLSQVSYPVALYYGQNDPIVSVDDVENLAKNLTNVAESHKIEYKYFNHIDFLLAKDVDSMLNFYVINTLNKYNGQPVLISTTTTLTTSTTSPRSTSHKPTPKPSSSSAVVPFSCFIFIQVILYYLQHKIMNW